MSQAAKQRAQGIGGLLLPAAAVPGAGDRREPACARRAQHRVDAGVLRGGREPRERALPGLDASVKLVLGAVCACWGRLRRVQCLLGTRNGETDGAQLAAAWSCAEIDYVLVCLPHAFAVSVTTLTWLRLVKDGVLYEDQLWNDPLTL